MSAANTIIVAGNLTADPEYRKTSSEIPFVRMRIAVNRRVFNSEDNRWEDRTDGYFTVTAWRDTARHASMSLKRGDRVVVHGRLTHREFEVTVAEGQTANRQTTEIDAEEIGASFRWSAWAKVQARPVTEGEPLAPGERADGQPGRSAGAASRLPAAAADADADADVDTDVAAAA